MFADNFEKLARGARIYDAYTRHLETKDPDLLSKLHKFEKEKGYDDPKRAKSFQKEYLPSYHSFLKERDQKAAREETHEWLSKKDLPKEIKRSPKDRLKRGLGVGVGGAALGGLAGLALGSPLRLLGGERGRKAAKLLTRVGYLGGAAGGFAEGAKPTDNNPYSGMKKSELRKNIRRDSDMAYMPDLYDIKI